MDEIRFFADQHYPAAVTDGLIRRGIDVVTAQSVGRCGVDDADQLAYATGIAILRLVRPLHHPYSNVRGDTEAALL